MVKVLVVEDEASIREMVALNLKMAGWEVVEAPSAERALELMHHGEECDAALLDIKGPLAMSTDSYTVTPLFFAGGSIGTLAVHGTVNDVAMLGARPRYLSCACIIESSVSFSSRSRCTLRSRFWRYSAVMRSKLAARRPISSCRVLSMRTS